MTMAALVVEELVEAILLRVPPDEPACLFRAALVCKDWRRIVSDRGFLRRYRRFHRSPPLLGYVTNCAASRFVPTVSSALPPPASGCGIAVDCRHGRVLLQRRQGPSAPQFSVWDPFSGDRQQVSMPTFPSPGDHMMTAAVLCAAEGCDHLGCHGGPFVVVVLGRTMPDPDSGPGAALTWVTIYSSQTRAWTSAPSASVSSTDGGGCHFSESQSSLLIGDALYFIRSYALITIFRYDMGVEPARLSVIRTPLQRRFHGAVLVEHEGSVGIVTMDRSRVYMWSQQQQAADGNSGWALHGVVEIQIPRCRFIRQVVSFVEGTDTVFISADHNGVYTLDLKSRQLSKVVANRCDDDILPFTSFYTPGIN